MTTRALSPAETATIARFDAAPEPPELLRERLARTLWETHIVSVDWPTHVPWPYNSDYPRWLELADAALAVIGGDR